MNDFTPEIRNSALWSSDSRRIAKGDASGVVLEKLGRIDPQPVDDEELVHMGLVMQPVVARIFEEQHGLQLQAFDRDDNLTHPQHSWLRSHFDYQARGGAFLVECKNYNAAYASHFSEAGDPVRVPDEDLAQCLHQAIVHGTSTVWLAVLFGGQRYRDFRLDFTADDKDKWTQRLAEVWGNIQTETIPPPATPAQAREIWPMDDSHSIVASKQIEMQCELLTRYKAQHKQNEDAIEALQAQIMGFMGARSVLVDLSGRTLATWKKAKDSKRFNAERFKQSMPQVYDSFVEDTLGSRRFLIKS